MSAVGLRKAAQDGDVAALRALLRKTPVDSASDVGRTALHLAAYHGRMECVEALVAARATVDALARDSWTPLLFASQNGHAQCVQALIAARANVDAANSNNASPLFLASQDGHTACVQALIAARANVDAATIKTDTPLHVAAHDGHTACVQALVAAGADVHAANNNNVTPLFMAAQNGHTACVQTLIAARANVDAVTNKNATPLVIAAEKGHTECVQALVAARANVDAANKNGATPLVMAAAKGHTECVQALIAGANVDIATKNGFTALYIAAEKGLTECLQALIAAGANVDAASNNGATALFIAAHEGQLACLQALIAAGANVDAANNGGATPLSVAAETGRTACLQALIAAGAIVDLARKSGATALYIAAQNGHTECLQALIAAGANVDAVEEDQWAGLHIAAQNGRTQCIEALIAARANVDTATNKGSTPLYIAAQQGSIECVQALITARANVDAAQKDGVTPLYIAAEKGQMTCVQALIAARANVDAAQKDGATPLFIAAQIGQTPCVQALIAARANVDAAQKDGATPLFIAAQMGQTPCVQALITARANVEAAVSTTGSTPIVAATKGAHVEAFQKLFHAGASLNVTAATLLLTRWEPDEQRRSVLHAAVLQGSLGNVDALAGAGAPLNATDRDGKTALHLAAEDNLLDMIRALGRHGADMDALDGTGQTALLVAVRAGQAETARALCESGASLEALVGSPKVVTALAACLKAGQLDAAAVLLTLGADSSAVTQLVLPDAGLQALPYALGRLRNLQKLELGRNPLATIPLVVKDGGTQAILEYLRALEAGRVAWRKVKIMVLGREGVGKTHLLRRMAGQKYARNESTNGVDIKEFVLEGAELTWFDFGGQEIFYPTHEFFLTPQCVYLVVFRLDDADYRQRLQYWLRVVAQFTKDRRRPTAAVVVATHADKLKAAQRDTVWEGVMALLRGYSFVVAVRQVSCTSGEGLDELRRALLDAINGAGLLNLQVPSSYVALHAWMLQKRAALPRLELAALRARFEGGGMSEPQAVLSCRFLMDAGVCFFHEELGLVVLDPQVLADHMKEVISFYSGVRDGIVTRTGLRHNAWKGLSDAQVDENMALFEKIHIAFAKPDEGQWVVPCMLPERSKPTPPSGSAKAVSRHWRKYELTLRKAGLMGRLMVRLQALPRVKLTAMWRSGAQFASRDGREVGQAVLEESGDGARLLVQCWTLGQARAAHEQHLIQDVSEECGALMAALHKRSMEVAYRELVGCPHCLDAGGATAEPSWLPKELCLQVIANNEPWFECGTERVPTARLQVDVTFGTLPLFDEGELQIEARPFAAGSFGLVSRAQRAGETVVVKELNPHKARAFRGESEEEGPPQAVLAFEEFQHEALLMSRLQHAHVVRLHGLMLNPLRLVMELCSEGDVLSALQQGRIWGGLRPALDDSSVVPPALCLKIASDVARGMAFLHGQQPPVAHRDLRSPNVFLVSLDPTAAVCAKVADFGLSVVVTARQTNALQAWQWMAPEAQLGASYSHLCDLYSYAIVVNELYTQRLPFIEYEAQDVLGVKHALQHEGLRPVIPAFVPAWLRALLQEMWQGSARARPSFAQCLRLLEQQQQPVHARLAAGAGGTGLVTRPLLDNADGSILCMRAQGDTVWLGGREGSVRAFSVREERQVRAEQHGEGRIQCLCCVSAVTAASGSSDGSVRVWSTGAAAALSSSAQSLFARVKALSGSGKHSSPLLAAKNAAPESDNNSPIKKLLSFRAPRAAAPSPEPATAAAEVTCLVALADGVLVQGTSSGLVLVLSLSGAVLAETELPEPISCGSAAPDGSAWLGVGRSVYAVMWADGELRAAVVGTPDVHDQPVRALAPGEWRGQMWSSTGRGQVVVWDGRSVRCRLAVGGGARVHSLCGAEIMGRPMMVVGCDDALQLWESITCSLSSQLALPRGGEVTAIVDVGADVLWTAVRHRGGKVSLLVWDFGRL